MIAWHLPFASPKTFAASEWPVGVRQPSALTLDFLTWVRVLTFRHQSRPVAVPVSRWYVEVDQCIATGHLQHPNGCQGNQLGELAAGLAQSGE